MSSIIASNLVCLGQGQVFKPKFNGRPRRQILSICTNVWSGTDPYRFAVSLYSCLFEGKQDLYLELIKRLYEGWNKNSPELCSAQAISMIPGAFLGLGYEFATFNPNEIEMILAIDGSMPIIEHDSDQFSWLGEGLNDELQRTKVAHYQSSGTFNENEYDEMNLSDQQTFNSNQHTPNFNSNGPETIQLNQQPSLISNTSEQTYMDEFSTVPIPKVLDDDAMYGGRDEAPAKPVETSIIEEIFKGFCNMIGCQWQILHVPKSNAGVCRTMAMQAFTSNYIIFRDDDDLNAPISRLLELTHIFDDKRRRKPNPSGYWNAVEREISSIDINPIELKKLIAKYQRSPTIAVLLATNKYKNTWASPDNPNCITPLPINVSTLEEVDRSIPGSMCSKIFSRESLELIYNSPSFGLLEDNRSRYLQEYVQKCLWIWPEDKLNSQRKALDSFKRLTLKREKLQPKAFKDMQKAIFELNINVLIYDNMQIGDFRDSKPNKNQISIWEEVLDNSIASPYHPLYSYLFPSGNYGTLSWSFGAVIALLEQCRQWHRSVDFSIGDLKLLKKIITTGIETKILDRDCKVEIISHLHDKIPRLCQALKTIVEYKYLLFNGYVHNEDDLKRLITQLYIIRDEMPHVKSYETSGNFQADIVRDEVYHNDQMLEVIVEAKAGPKHSSTNKRLMCVSGAKRAKVHPELQGNLDDENFTTYVKNARMNGGCVVCYRQEELRAKNPHIKIHDKPRWRSTITRDKPPTRIQMNKDGYEHDETNDRPRTSEHKENPGQDEARPRLLGGSSGPNIDIILAILMIVGFIIFLIYMIKQEKCHEHIELNDIDISESFSDSISSDQESSDDVSASQDKYQ